MSDTRSRTAPTQTEAEKAKARAHAREVTVQLVIPIKVEGIEVTEIKVRRLRAEEQLEIADMDITDARKARSIVTRATGMSPEDVGQLDAADYLAINEVIESFLSARQSK